MTVEKRTRTPYRPLRAGLRAGLVCGIGLAAASCGGDTSGPEAGVIDRETFIATYVDLRSAALATTDGLLTDSARTAVLAKHFVQEADLTSFAELHGEDVTFLRSVWDDVESRLDQARIGSERRP